MLTENIGINDNTIENKNATKNVFALCGPTLYVRMCECNKNVFATEILGVRRIQVTCPSCLLSR